MALTRDDVRCLYWRIYVPHLVKGVHIEGQGVKLAVIIGNGRIGIAVKLSEAIHILPGFLAVGVKDMGTIAVNLNSLNLLGEHIAADVVPFFNHQDGFFSLKHPLSKGRTEQPCPHHQIIVVHFGFLFLWD